MKEKAYQKNHPLKEVSFNSYKRRHNIPGETEKAKLVKHMMNTNDPQELKKLMGYSKVTRVFNVIDRIQNDKNMRNALIGHGLDFDSIAKSLKVEMLGAEKSADRLNAIKIALKIYGVGESKDDGDGSGTSWEELLKQKTDEYVEGEIEEDDLMLEEGIKNGNVIQDYEVIVPQIPDSAKKKREEEAETLGSIYE